MSEVYFISDLHLGHKNILKFAGHYRDGDSIEDHDKILEDKWRSIVTKRDTVYVLGDVAFCPKALVNFANWPGYKLLIRGNHDKMQFNNYLRVFNGIGGITKYQGHWLTHCPIHPQELRGRKNIHGHTHQNVILDVNGQPDKRYWSVCVEALDGFPHTLEQLKGIYK